MSAVTRIVVTGDQTHTHTHSAVASQQAALTEDTPNVP
jgi:hypothetical protein